MLSCGAGRLGVGPASKLRVDLSVHVIAAVLWTRRGGAFADGPDQRPESRAAHGRGRPRQRICLVCIDFVLLLRACSQTC